MFYGKITLRSFKHTQCILKEAHVQAINIVLRLLFVVCDGGGGMCRCAC